MNTEDLAARALELVARIPFLERREIAPIAGWTERDARTAISHLIEREWVDTVQHSTSLITSSDRFWVNAAGVRTLALNQDRKPAEILDTYPVSREWRDVLMGRLDGLAVVHRLIGGLARIVGPVDVRLYRSHQLDATVILPDGSTIGVLRQGRFASRGAFAERLDRLFRGPLAGSLLVVASDPVRLRHLGNTGRLSSTSRPVHLILEEHAVTASRASPVWWPSEYTTPLTLEAAMSEPMRRLPAPEEKKPKRVSPPGGLLEVHLDGDFPVRRLPSELQPREKQLLDALAGWTWLSTQDLCAILGIRTSSRLWRLTSRLRALGLLHHTDSGGRRRLFLSDRGLEPLALRDRCSHRDLVKRWSVELSDPGGGLHRENVSGSNSRQLLLHMTHTEAVHHFVAGLAGSARSQGISVLQLDPPAHASRYFQDDQGHRSLLPDAYGMLGLAGRKCAFFLEYERRAVHASTMLEKLAPYIAYYSTSRPADDQEVVPLVLFVFESDDRAARFSDVARRQLDRSGTHLPLWVSSDESLSQGGPLRPVWRTPFGDELRSPLNDDLSR